MQIHELKSDKKKKKKRVGRGGKRGTYSGRGVKGQKARAGTRKNEPIIRKFIKQFHKLSGYKRKSRNSWSRVVSLTKINDNFKERDIVSPKTLCQKGIIKKKSGRYPKIKILDGELNKKLKFQNCSFSASAKKKINK